MTKLSFSSLPCILILLLSSIPFFVSSVPTSPADKATLLLFKRRLNYPSALRSWNPKSNPCSRWSGVQCSDDGTGNVVGLVLHNFNITGTVIDLIYLMKNLQTLDLGNNHFQGDFQTSILKLSKLSYLDLSKNNFSGIIPANIDLLGSLEYLDLSSNKFTGNIPKSLENCKSLIVVNVSDNNFSGEFPSGLWSLNRMNSLLLGDNKLSGMLPDNLGSNLTIIKASNNMFNGKIPKGLANLPHLTAFEFNGNLLSGVLPPMTLSSMSLFNLSLARNKLSGPIPVVYGYSSSRLSVLDLSFNQLSGHISFSLGKLKFTSLNLSSNHLSGCLPRELDNKNYDLSFLDNPELCSYTGISNLSKCTSKSCKKP